MRLFSQTTLLSQLTLRSQPKSHLKVVFTHTAAALALVSLIAIAPLSAPLAAGQ